jgi:dipeptidyl aminopeptidase/acylaminoacyl peptidase
VGSVIDLFWSRELNSFVFTKIDPDLRDQKIIYLLDRSGSRARRVGEINRTSSTWEPVDDKYCGVSGHDLIFIDEAAGSPPRISKMSLVTGRSTVLLDPNEASRSSFPNRVERYSWVNKRGDGATAHLIYPSNYKEGKAYPLVLVQYVDNGFLRGGTGDEVPAFPIADSGMFVLDISWPWRNESAHATYAAQRKSEGLPVSYEARQFEEVDEMVGDVIDKLTKAGKVNPSKIAFTGLSAGAQYVNYALKTHRVLAAAITAGDPTDPMLSFLTPPPPEPGARWAGLEPLASSKPAPPLSPDPHDQVLTASLQGAEVETPLLINAADHEYLMWLGLVTQMHAARKPVEMYVFEDEYHVKWQPAHRLAIYDRNIDWLRFWLQGYEDPDVSKRAMYERWESMRTPATAK